jgi:hypothetical protein
MPALVQAETANSVWAAKQSVVAKLVEPDSLMLAHVQLATDKSV